MASKSSPFLNLTLGRVILHAPSFPSPDACGSESKPSCMAMQSFARLAESQLLEIHQAA